MPPEIGQVALLVHPDFHLIEAYPLDPIHEELRKKWNHRVQEAANDRNQALFYYSGYSFNPKQNPDPKALHAERERRIFHGLALGSRFLYFYSPDRPESNSISQQMTKRNLQFRRDGLQIEAFGEYVELCVLTYAQNFESALKKLGIRRINFQINPKLSVKVLDYIQAY